MLQLAGGNRTTLAWDAANRLSQITLPTGQVVTSLYRHDDLRLRRIGPGGGEVMLWDGSTPLARITDAGPAQLFSHGENLVRALGTRSGPVNVSRQYHLDNQGSVEAITGADQSTETRYVTDAWGNVISGSAPENPFVYLGGLGYQQDPDTGLDYVRARWLDPATARWMSVDPAPGEPRYAYARSSSSPATANWRPPI